jgi:hypothetical protein
MKSLSSNLPHSFKLKLLDEDTQALRKATMAKLPEFRAEFILAVVAYCTRTPGLTSCSGCRFWSAALVCGPDLDLGYEGEHLRPDRIPKWLISYQHFERLYRAELAENIVCDDLDL